MERKKLLGYLDFFRDLDQIDSHVRASGTLIDGWDFLALTLGALFTRIVG